MTILVSIITHNRPAALLRLLKDISRDLPARGYVIVYEDPSDADYLEAKTYCENRQWLWLRAREHHGKTNHWKLVTSVYEHVRVSPAATFFQFPDDIRLCDDFFTQALSRWHTISDPKKLAMNLLRDSRAEGLCWTPVRPQDAGHVLQVGWIDGLFVACRDYYEQLAYRAPEVENIWAKNPLRGSGVYEKVSCALYQVGNFYCVKESLVVHTDVESEMNPEARRQAPLRAVNFIDGEEAHERLARDGVDRHDP